MSTELSRLSELATADKTTRFLSLAHLLTPAALMAAFEGLRKDASAGVDEVTYREYEQNVWRNIPTLHHRLVSHQYRAQPLRRVYIPKENGQSRPISIPALEDKIVQRANGHGAQRDLRAGFSPLFLRLPAGPQSARRARCYRLHDVSRSDGVCAGSRHSALLRCDELPQSVEVLSLVRRLWHKWLNRRTRGKRLAWDRFPQLLTRHPLLRPRICHAWTRTGSPA